MELNKGIKTISEYDINPIFLLPMDERMRKVNELLNNLHRITPDISFFDLDEAMDGENEGYCKDGK